MIFIPLWLYYTYLFIYTYLLYDFYYIFIINLLDIVSLRVNKTFVVTLRTCKLLENGKRRKADKKINCVGISEVLNAYQERSLDDRLKIPFLCPNKIKKSLKRKAA